MDVDYVELRELWALDPRMSKFHTESFGQLARYVEHPVVPAPLALGGGEDLIQGCPQSQVAITHRQ